MAAGRPAFGSRFTTGSEESALLSRGFQYGTAPGALVVGWNSYHTAVTLPDGTPVASGESGSGVRIGGGGAYQSQFTHHMFLPVDAESAADEVLGMDAAFVDDAAPAAPDPERVQLMVVPLPTAELPPPVDELPPPLDELPPPLDELPPPVDDAPPAELPPPPAEGEPAPA